MDGNESKDRIISLSNNTVKKVADKIDLSDRTEGKIAFIDSTNKHKGKSGFIALYKINVYISGKEYSGYSILHFVGIDSIGNQLTHDECSEIFNLKAESNSEEKLAESICKTLTNIFENQKQALIENANQDNLKWIAIEVNQIKNKFANKTQELTEEIEIQEKDIAKLKNTSAVGEFSTAFMKNQQIAKLTNELNKLKQNEFITKMKIKKEQDDAIKNFHESLKPFIMVTRSFIVEFNVRRINYNEERNSKKNIYID